METSKRPLRVFIAEDDEGVVVILTQILKMISDDVEVEHVRDGESAIARLQTVSQQDPRYFDLIIADIFLEGEATGIDLWKKYERLCPDMPVLVTSGLPIHKFFSAIGPDAVSPPFLAKPFEPLEAKRMIEGILDYSGGEKVA